MSPRYVFRIEEINPSRDGSHHGTSYPTAYQNWIPSPHPRDNVRNGRGASGVHFLCDGKKIVRYPGASVPTGIAFYKAYSVYYSSGDGFYVLAGDVTHPLSSQGWLPLKFDWENTCTAFLTSAGTQSTLQVQRIGSRWPFMLLPDIYHAPPQGHNHTNQYGGLIGELPIFLALMAFSVSLEHAEWLFTNHFAGGKWREHSVSPNGRVHKRGIVVYVYTKGESTSEDLDKLEHGQYGKYFY